MNFNVKIEYQFVIGCDYCDAKQVLYSGIAWPGDRLPSWDLPDGWRQITGPSYRLNRAKIVCPTHEVQVVDRKADYLEVRESFPAKGKPASQCPICHQPDHDGDCR